MLIFKCDKCGYTSELEDMRDSRLMPSGMIGWLRNKIEQPDDHWKASALNISDIEWILSLRPRLVNYVNSSGYILSSVERAIQTRDREFIRKYIFERNGVRLKWVYIPLAFEEEEVDWIDNRPVYGYTATCPKCGYSGPGDKF